VVFFVYLRKLARFLDLVFSQTIRYIRCCLECNSIYLVSKSTVDHFILKKDECWRQLVNCQYYSYFTCRSSGFTLWLEYHKDNIEDSVNSHGNARKISAAIIGSGCVSVIVLGCVLIIWLPKVASFNWIGEFLLVETLSITLLLLVCPKLNLCSKRKGST
jgi:hypothetical protein